LSTSNASSVYLYNNEYIYSSNQLYAVGLQNYQFGVYKAYGYNNVSTISVWNATQTSTPSTLVLVAQNVGNLVIYANASTSAYVWASSTTNYGLNGNPYTLSILNNGTLQLTNGTNYVIWHT
jgi:hypothetical protein